MILKEVCLMAVVVVLRCRDHCYHFSFFFAFDSRFSFEIPPSGGDTGRSLKPCTEKDAEQVSFPKGIFKSFSESQS